VSFSKVFSFNGVKSLTSSIYFSAKMGFYNSFKLAEPSLCMENVELVRERLKELGYDGPLALATDCTKVKGSSFFGP